MASRRIYLEVAAHLRVAHLPIVPTEMLHSGLVLKLRAEVIESEILLGTRLAYMQAAAALHSHPATDIEKSGDAINKQYFDALATIPYMTQGRTSKEMLSVEREKSVARYKDMKKRLLKDPDGNDK